LACDRSTEDYGLLRPYVVYLRIKDALLADCPVVVADAGDGELVETVRALHDDGFFSPGAASGQVH
jgi:hypothetical protein